MSSTLDKTIQNIDLSKYQVRFNQKNYNQMSIIKDNIVKYVLTFHFIGMIDTNKHIFIWSNIIPGVNKNFIKKNNKIKSLSSNYQDFSKNNNEIIFQILNENMIHLNEKINPDFIKNTFHKVLNKPTLLLENTNGKFQLVSIHSIDEAY